MELRIDGSQRQLRRRRFDDGGVLLGGGRRVGGGLFAGNPFQQFGTSDFDEWRLNAPAQ